MGISGLRGPTRMTPFARVRLLRDYGLLIVITIVGSIFTQHFLWPSVSVLSTAAFGTAYVLVLVAFDVPLRVLGRKIDRPNLFSRDLDTTYRFVAFLTAAIVASVAGLIVLATTFRAT